jgi:hypothetical protein
LQELVKRYDDLAEHLVIRRKVATKKSFANMISQYNAILNDACQPVRDQNKICKQ